ncbi:hypothetical protein KPL37_13775 [Clostridium frigoris]|uniref:Uncharacterized protein n=1 Tax=Clostridium frigoris TaxID=205327 RepID=A0ABS6BWF1_9CLOT|nr:hypothetical protein [Clostridium frigoris]MBU3160810.1 hypothetical protein [Clostridium frigoris]
MRNIISIICFLILAVFLFKDYLRDKRIYKILGIFLAFILIVSRTSFLSGISKTSEDSLMGIVAILTISIFYLLIKDIKEKRNSKKS